MEPPQEDVSTDIFDITHACLQSFDRIVADHDETLLTKPLASSEGITNRSRNLSTYDFLGLRNSFLFWIDYTGALSLMSSSLDARLQGLQDISSMVVELLEMIQRNLQRVERKPGSSSPISPSPMKLARSKTWQDASQAVETALDRLHFIAIAIRKASARKLGHSVTSFVTDEDIVFRRDIASWVRYRFPAARKGLCQQLGDSIAIRRRILLHTERHAKRLAVRRVPAKAPSVRHDSKQPNLRPDTRQKADNRGAYRPSVLASGITKASRPDPHSPALQVLHRRERRALTTVISTISTTHDDKFDYPPVPKAAEGETQIRCPFCFRPLNLKDLAARDDHWRHHIDEHLKPYGCLFPECAESQLYFTHRNQWKTHLETAHSKDWLRKVHTILWYCDVDHDPPETFETEQQWREHMLNLESHPKRKLKAPTPVQLDALSPRKQQVALRDKFVCPLCEQIPERIQPLVEKGRGDEAEMYSFVVDHVANHLKSLSLMAVPSFDTAAPESPGAFGRSAYMMGDSFKRPMHENSLPQPPSGKEHLDQISLPSGTWSNSDQVPVPPATSVGPSSVWDKEYLDYRRPEDLPEPQLLDQEWLEGWISWRTENDPFPLQGSQTDPILAHFTKARSLVTVQEPTLDQVDPDIDKKDETGRTTLSFAAEFENAEAVRKLLKRGAGLEVEDQDGQTPLLWAASSGNEETSRVLLDAGARVDAADQKYGRTPLSWAASKGHEAVMRLLLERGAEVDAADNSRRTPLSWAASRGQEAAVLLLMQRGADIESSDPKYGHTPLSWAAVRGHENTVRLLLDHGVNVNPVDVHGRTPLSWAAENGYEAIVRKLVLAGGDIEATDQDGLQTPLMFAAENGHEGTVKLLVEMGARVGTKDSQGWTALEWAEDGGYDELVRLLRELGGSHSPSRDT